MYYSYTILEYNKKIINNNNIDKYIEKINYNNHTYNNLTEIEDFLITNLPPSLLI